MANVDGDGYQVKLVKHADGVMVEAGCFRGTADEFVRVTAEKGLTNYSLMIQLIAANMK